MTDFRNFKGAAKRLDDIDLPRLAERIHVGEDEIHAFIDAETSGSGFDASGRPKMLFEPHVFHRLLSGDKRQRAIKEGLAYATWGMKPYPRDSYPRLLKAIAIDETAALMAASWGLAQVMGENFKVAGYKSPQQMVLAFLDDEETHLEAAINFIIGNKLDSALRDHRWADFAKGYNGAGYKKNRYDEKLSKAFAKWGKVKDTPYQRPTAIISQVVKTPKNVSSNDLILQVQTLLRDKGYPEVGNADGIYGNRTRNSILAFQADNALALTGKATDDVLAALVKAPVRQNSPAREGATATDLKEIGIPTVEIGDRLQKVAIGVITTSGLGGVIDGTASLQDLQRGLSDMRGFIDAVKEFSPWIVGGAVGLVALYFAKKIIHAQVVAYRLGHSV